MGMLPIILMFVVLYFLMIRPQMKKAKEHKTMLEGLQKGDEVVAMGILGRISKISDNYLSPRDRPQRDDPGAEAVRVAAAAQGHHEGRAVSRMNRYPLWKYALIADRASWWPRSTPRPTSSARCPRCRSRRKRCP